MPGSTRLGSLRFRHLAAVTTGLTFLLILLGVYTATMGAGLACSGQWPLCDGGLLPQSVPSFIEWFHRLVAMITGFFILGTTAWAWRRDRGQDADGDDSWTDRDGRRIRAAATLALVALPVQVVLGGLTVGIYQPIVNTAHHGAALVIFGALLATTLWAFDAGRGGRRSDETGAAAGG